MGKQWNVEGLKEHEHYVEKFYNDAEQKIPQNVKKEIESLNFVKFFEELSAKAGNSEKRKRNSDAVLGGHIANWTVKPVVGQHRWQLDFEKDNVGLEIETRQNTNLFHDLLKLELGYRKNGLLCGIIISYYKKSVGKLGYGAYIEELDMWIDELKEIMNINLPLWAIGLKAINGVTKNPELVVTQRSSIAALLKEVDARGQKGQWYSVEDHNYGAVSRVRKGIDLKEKVKIRVIGEGKDKKVYLQKVFTEGA